MTNPQLLRLAEHLQLKLFKIQERLDSLMQEAQHPG